MTTDQMQAWFDGLFAHVRGQAGQLRAAGWTYETAAWEKASQPGVGAAWPILAERLIDEGYSWAQITQQLGLNDDQDEDDERGNPALIKRLENQAAALRQKDAIIDRQDHRIKELEAKLAAKAPRRRGLLG